MRRITKVGVAVAGFPILLAACSSGSSGSSSGGGGGGAATSSAAGGRCSSQAASPPGPGAIRSGPSPPSVPAVAVTGPVVCSVI